MTAVNACACGLVVALLVTACASHPPGHGGAAAGHRAGGGYYENDGPPADSTIDWSQIPDAIPKKEPRSAYGNPASYTAFGKTYHVLTSAAGFTQTGTASWYGRQFAGQRTSSGQTYSLYKMTAAHKRLPIPCYVRVTNLDNHKHVVVRINDRGPFRKGRIIDLSYVAARRLGIVATGSAPVRIRMVTADTGQTPRAGHDRARPTHAMHRHRGRKRVAARGRDPALPKNADAGKAPAPAGSAATRPAPARPVAGSASASFLQTGAFKNPDHADAARARLQDQGVRQVRILKPSSAVPLYRVRVGPFRDPVARDSARRMLAAQGFSVRVVER